MRQYRVFSIGDVQKLFPGMNPMNLVRWQKMEYIIRIRNGWYCFNDTESSENIDWLAANLIYAPSYVSLHAALSYYGVIPEAIFETTSITTRKTNQFKTLLGNYSYHHVKQNIFGFGQTCCHTIVPDLKLRGCLIQPFLGIGRAYSVSLVREPD